MTRWITLASCALKKSAPSSASAAEAATSFENYAGDMDGAIDVNWRTIMASTAKEEVATGLTASVRGTEVKGIRVHIE
jgi:hypothetical protein